MDLTHATLRLGTLRPVVALVQRLGRGNAISQGSPARPAVALTFDDGPHPRWTPEILDRLDEGGARATFFVVGRNVEKHPELVRDARRRGHEIGIHSYTHQRGTVEDDAAFTREVGQSKSQLEALLGEPVRWLRFPYGERGRQDPVAILRATGLRSVHWTYSSLDSRERDPADIVTRVNAGLRSGVILLMHDALADEGPELPPQFRAERDATVAAIPGILAGISARRLRAVTLSELIDGSPVPLQETGDRRRP